eukprot:symbB.v1.2.009209.t1/scaffold580.1/size320225/11
MSSSDTFLEQLDDCQKNELVGRALRDCDMKQWSQLLHTAALDRCDLRSVHCVDMSGRSVELKIKPFQTLFSIKQDLLSMANSFLPPVEKWQLRDAQIYHREIAIPDHTLGAMLPNEMSVVYRVVTKIMNRHDASSESESSGRFTTYAGYQSSESED